MLHPAPLKQCQLFEMIMETSGEVHERKGSRSQVEKKKKKKGSCDPKWTKDVLKKERQTDRQEEEYENNYLVVDVFNISFYIQINIYLKGTLFNYHISERDLHPRTTCFNSVR